VIIFENVTKTYERQTALRDISFHVEKGEMLFITGPSGAGKSTLLKLIYHAEKPDAGSITISGQKRSDIKDGQVPFVRRNIGIVFQDFRLLATRTVYENVALALRIRDMRERDIKPFVMETLKNVNLRHKADSYPPQLSGGEQQRVVIARAIVAEPMLLLADEPTGNLDPETSSDILKIFKDINAKGTTVVIATHNRDMYTNSGRRLFRLLEGSLAGEERA
jgi:cell division transport system ATP-binding protein